MFKGELDLPGMTNFASGSLACMSCTTAANSRLQALGRMAVSRLKMLQSPCVRSRRVNHRAAEQAPGDGRFSRRPLLGDDGFVLNTNRRGSETGSNGQEERAGLALLEGVMDQLHKRGTTAVPLFGPGEEQCEAPDGTE